MAEYHRDRSGLRLYFGHTPVRRGIVSGGIVSGGTVFRRIYTQVFLMLIVSTTLLLGLLGSAVYLELRRQLQASAEASLTVAVAEVREALHDQDGDASVAGRTATNAIALNDIKGRSVFFVLLRGRRVESRSSAHPVPAPVLIRVAAKAGFAQFDYGGSTYRAYTVLHWRGRNEYLIVYAKTQIEEETLRRFVRIMSEAGGIGMLVSLGFSLWLARRAIRPAQATWTAYQEAVTLVSHELQTPLAAMQAVLSSPPVDEHARALLQHEVSEASHLVNDILYWSRLGKHMPSAASYPVAVSDIAEECAVRFQPFAQHRNIWLEGAAEPGLYVRTTDEKWERLLSTVFKNVIDHAQPGSRAVWALSADGSQVAFSTRNQVRTDGRPQHFPKGIGLRIVDRLVAEMGGTWRMSPADAHMEVTIRVPRLRE
ncbi:MAG: HAMP domain-containing histidine kinase [Alicyclobacillus sp.]|nr:HAMP domain-containing histidine kinase [Alicyclobacillus sp.]